MFGDFLKGILTFIFAFILGAGCAQDKPAADSELQQKVQDHMDVIMDESAGIVDDVMDEIRKDERVQEMQDFADNVNEIVDNTKADIKEHFGKEEAAKETEEQEAPEAEEKAAEAEEPAAEESAAEAEEPAAEEKAEETKNS